MSYIDHFKELRNRLIFSFIFMFFCFFIFFYNADTVAKFLSKPLFDLLNESEKNRMIFTGLPEVFVSYLKISFFSAFLTSFPIFILQFSLFISPALYKKEKKFFLPIFFLIPFLFFLGLAFAYYLLIPIIWNFFLSFEINSNLNDFSLELESRFGEYMKLIMYLLFSCGVSFLFPILLLILSKMNIVNVKSLRKNRKYFFVGILIFSAVFTPPDIISQLGIAVPLILFFEISILLISFTQKKD